MFIPKKLLFAAGAVAILVVGILIGASFGNNGENMQPARELAAAGNAVQPALGTADAIREGTEMQNGLVKVIRVVDGDTIEVELDGKVESVRYIGIDTPETLDPRKPVQCFGVEAAKKNRELVEGRMVRLEKDITERDKYNRLLRYVWLGETLINLELVQQGFAASYSYPPDIKHQDTILAAEKKAREDELGLWNACASGTAPAAAIASPSIQTPALNSSCTIKGNISASGEKIYHLEGCGSYAKTAIATGRGERWFCSEPEARAAGWRRALNCP